MSRKAGFDRWPLPPGRDDDATLEAALFQRMVRPPQDIQEPDWSKVATELKRKDVTLVLLWQEYRAAHPEGYAYTSFCEQFRALENRTSPSFRNRHEAGAVRRAVPPLAGFCAATWPVLSLPLTCQIPIFCEGSRGALKRTISIYTKGENLSSFADFGLAGEDAWCYVKLTPPSRLPSAELAA